jgi:hypothetical protein
MTSESQIEKTKIGNAVLTKGASFKESDLQVAGILIDNGPSISQLKSGNDTVEIILEKPSQLSPSIVLRFTPHVDFYSSD